MMPLLKIGKASSTVAESIHEAEGISGPTVNPKLEENVPTTDDEEPAAVKGQPQGWIAETSVPMMTKATIGLVPSRTGNITSLPVPFDIYGSGPIKIMFLTGLGLTRSSWMSQIEFFATKPAYSCLVIDTRGFDDMECAIPLKIAGTKQYGREMKRALEDLGWNEPKSVHLVGFSMGGMIALQMGRICPEYIASLHLVATAAKYRSPDTTVANLVNTLQLLRVKKDNEKTQKYLDLLFTPEHLYAHNEEYPDFQTNRERYLQLDKDGFVFAKKQNVFNYYTQVLACKRHSLSQADLWQIAANVRFLFVSGAEQDALFHSECSRELMLGLNAQGRMYPGGHFIPAQFKDEFNADQEAMIHRAVREYQEYPPTEILCLSDPNFARK